MCIAHATHLTYSARLMKIGDFPQNQIRKIAYVPPLAHARVRGGSLSLSEVKVKGCLYFVLFPSYFFLFSVSTVRLAHNQTVCQRSMSCDFPHNTADYTKTAATPSNLRTVSGIRVRPFAVVDVMTANSLYHATPQFANCGLRAAKGIVQRHSLQTVNLQVWGAGTSCGKVLKVDGGRARTSAPVWTPASSLRRGSSSPASTSP